MTQIVDGTSGGRHIAGSPLTTDATRLASPDLLRNAIDERIVHVRPTSTPVDQLSRCAGARHCGAMTVEYYSVDTKKISATVKPAVTSAPASDRGNGMYTYNITVDDPKIFDPSETILFPTVDVNKDIVGAPTRWLVAYIADILDDGTLVIAPVNTPLAGADGDCRTLPDLPAGTPVVRMGRAAAELDVQTAQFEALPRKASNYCQIFKMQIEQSTLQKIADKEVGWTFSDQEEAAVIDMRLGMEKNFLFGEATRVYDYKKKEWVYLTGGIWYQAGQDMKFRLSALDETIIGDLCARAFTGNNGSKKKLLLCGSGFMQALSTLPATRFISGTDTLVKWGIQFKEIVSNFGTLYVLHSEVFDQCCHPNDAFVLDPDYITKYCHIPFSVETLDLRTSGVRNTDAVVLTEASCLALRCPAAHMRIVTE